MFKPKSYICKWCGKRHYVGSLVSRQHKALLKKFGKMVNVNQKHSWVETIYDKPFKVTYGYRKTLDKYFIDIFKYKNGSYKLGKRTYYKTYQKMMFRVKYHKRVANLNP